MNDPEDSLFGSPPPSPGRSPSPALALPSASTSATGLSTSIFTKNVGTIALPGSHPYSELPINPLASSLSGKPAPRPLAHLHTQVASAPLPWSNSLSRASSSTPPSPGPSIFSASSARPGRKRKLTDNSKSKESTPRPEAQITLPDPTAPLPAHFLRNQSALLGMAGLVGGVNPAILDHRNNTRGATLSNPIVVEEENDTPILGRNTRLIQSQFLPFDSSQLPMPSVQEIVAMLVKHKDIFPVLENILKLIASGSQALNPPPRSAISNTLPQQAFQKAGARTDIVGTHATGYPMKKRKLNRVPAGATDWDVPYPFARGEGPESYQTTWERERGKQLISQLVNLIKTAAKKAAAKSYIERHHPTLLRKVHQRYAETESPKATPEPELRVNKYYKPSTATYGRGPKEVQTPLKTPAQVSRNTPNVNSDTPQAVPCFLPLKTPALPSSAPVAATLTEQPQMSGSFDQLISSLLSASGAQADNNSNGSTNATNVEANMLNSLDTTSLMANSEQALDHDLFDSWMSVLQTFPTPSEGFSHLAQQSPFPQRDVSDIVSSSMSATSFDDFDFSDFGMNLGPGDFSTGPTSNPSGMNNTGSSTSTTMYAPVSRTSDDHRLIDPDLLTISIPRGSVGGSLPVSSAPSPIPSMSSFGGTDPATPISANWDMTTPDIYNGGPTGFEDDGIMRSGLDGAGTAGGRGVEDPAIMDFMASLGVHPIKENSTALDKGKQREDHTLLSPVSNPPTAGPLVPSTQPAVEPVTSKEPSSSTKAPQPRMPGPAKRKEELIQKTRARKAQLEAELNRVKLQLWETTIEQAALTHVVSYYQEKESREMVQDQTAS